MCALTSQFEIYRFFSLFASQYHSGSNRIESISKNERGRPFENFGQIVVIFYLFSLSICNSYSGINSSTNESNMTNKKFHSKKMILWLSKKNSMLKYREIRKCLKVNSFSWLNSTAFIIKCTMRMSLVLYCFEDQKAALGENVWNCILFARCFRIKMCIYRSQEYSCNIGTTGFWWWSRVWNRNPRLVHCSFNLNFSPSLISWGMYPSFRLF